MLRGVIGSTLQDDELEQRSRAFAARVDVEAGARRAVALLESLGRRS